MAVLQPVGMRVIMPYSAVRLQGQGARFWPAGDASSDEGIVLLWMLQCGWRLQWKFDAERRFADRGLFLRSDILAADVLLHGMITYVIVQYIDSMAE